MLWLLGGRFELTERGMLWAAAWLTVTALLLLFVVAPFFLWGTLYHYPNRYDHQKVSIAGAPAPPKIAVQIYVQGIMTKMTVRHMQGEPIEKTLSWAESEVEGYLRTEVSCGSGSVG
jgi:hypothetical protein